jgi:hypothetical protein
MGRFACFIFALMLFGCYQYKNVTQPSKPYPTGIDQSMSETGPTTTFKGKIGERVMVEGNAVNAKSGAAIEAGDCFLFIGGRDHWPTDVIGKPVQVVGILRVKKIIPDAIMNSHGVLSQGAPGHHAVLEDAVWQLR